MALVMVIATLPRLALAQVTPAAGFTPPDDTPSIRLGATIYTDYTFMQQPKAIDADGNTISANAFNVGRAYINITGNISHLVAFRITPDIARETGAGSSLNGSLTFRIKYTFLQVNLDEWTTPGTWVRLGIQQTPWVDFEEGIYRYRFQGTVFSEREGFLSSSDAGASFHYNVPNNRGELHVGIYNGETYSKVEVNDQKALQIRGSVRPLATSSTLSLRGLRAHVFYDADNYIKSGARSRFIGSVTFEHQYLNAGLDYLRATDQTSATKPELSGKGYSIWGTPRSPKGFEGLFRYDHLQPDRSVDARKSRTITGVSYWFPHQGTVSTAVLVDYEQVNFNGFTQARPVEKRVAVHALVNF